jgi:hypothetical protein
MKRRINLTLDSRIVMQAKALAHQRGSSVSALVEAGLQSLANNSNLKDASFADNMDGQTNIGAEKSSRSQARTLNAKIQAGLKCGYSSTLT